ncbi:hypothetical protein M441DRAFT_395014 [Trichoderma asperellum CBS 433.97]|uniref:Secreted protein n=1 Tax=Trichoderma asperellum (strain ATCC 204424 / CBS 433.97 / NBRC 101777) TaxID=1042311 RepID=A0A2T3Z8X1_TRIA4|nr:hypothetical protein M441DRAFT_395014 [Trichoderma asperellum CBS 433.97]PTB41232.1 hypothetical protein M441DRAFT_395014 [Trichoderma asperellum CBS 433.97]
MYFALHTGTPAVKSIPLFFLSFFFFPLLHGQTALCCGCTWTRARPKAGGRARVTSIFAPSQELLQVRRIRIKPGLWTASTWMGTNGRLACFVIHDSRLLTK